MNKTPLTAAAVAAVALISASCDWTDSNPDRSCNAGHVGANIDATELRTEHLQHMDVNGDGWICIPHAEYPVFKEIYSLEDVNEAL